MMKSERLMTVSGLALSLALAPWAAQAADIMQTLQDEGQYSKLVNALEQAGLSETLKSEGPFTIFAPTDAAFANLQQSGQSGPSQGGQNQSSQSAHNQSGQGQSGQSQQQAAQGRQKGGDVLQQVSDDQLKTILAHHVIKGPALETRDLYGRQQTVETMSGDQLQVDGTETTLLLVPTGLQVARVGGEVFVRREMTAMAHPAVTVSMGNQQQSGQSQSSQQGQQMGQSTQQQAASSQSGQQSGGQSGQQQTANAGNNADGPAMGEVREEYREAVRNGSQSGQSQSGKAQQQASKPQSGGQSSGGSDDQGQRMSEQQGLMRASIVVEPDVQADNGIIHGIDQVLVPQKIEQELMSTQSGQAQGATQPQG